MKGQRLTRVSLYVKFRLQYFGDIPSARDPQVYVIRPSRTSWRKPLFAGVVIKIEAAGVFSKGTRAMSLVANNPFAFDKAFRLLRGVSNIRSRRSLPIDLKD